MTIVFLMLLGMQLAAVVFGVVKGLLAIGKGLRLYLALRIFVKQSGEVRGSQLYSSGGGGGRD